MLRITVPAIDSQETALVGEVLNSGFLVQGEKVEEFENLVATYVGTKYAVAVTSGTSALHLSLLALDVGAGDEVITTDFTFPATANVIEAVGATPILVDIDPDSYNIDVDRIEEKISPRTKAIIPVHLFGQCAAMEKIVQLAARYELKVIEDAACALGAKYRGRAAGSLGEVGCFSFHPRKTITTGEGGIITTDHKELADKLRSLRNHGLENNNGKVDFPRFGYNYRMTEFQAALGIVQMGKLEGIINQKRRLARVYNHALSQINGLVFPREHPEIEHTYQSYVIVLPEGSNRDKIISNLKQKGIEATIGTYAIHMLAYYKDRYHYQDEDFPQARLMFEQSLTLPLHNQMNSADAEFVADTLIGLIG
jgi:dTDP-4-amino-4,6-dideoxygalactose transaminase